MNTHPWESLSFQNENLSPKIQTWVECFLRHQQPPKNEQEELGGQAQESSENPREVSQIQEELEVKPNTGLGDDVGGRVGVSAQCLGPGERGAPAELIN